MNKKPKKEKRRRPSVKEQGEEALKIDLSGMDPTARKWLDAQFRTLHRTGQLNLPVAFRLINEIEGSPELHAWNAEREEVHRSMQMMSNRFHGEERPFPDYLLTIPE
jgi:hypothetical protein